MAMRLAARLKMTVSVNLTTIVEIVLMERYYGKAWKVSKTSELLWDKPVQGKNLVAIYQKDLF